MWKGAPRQKASEKFGGRAKGTQAFNFTTGKGLFFSA